MFNNICCWIVAILLFFISNKQDTITHRRPIDRSADTPKQLKFSLDIRSRFTGIKLNHDFYGPAEMIFAISWKFSILSAILQRKCYLFYLFFSFSVFRAQTIRLCQRVSLFCIYYHIQTMQENEKPANVIRRLPVVVTRWRFELQTHCLKGNCSAN